MSEQPTHGLVRAIGRWSLTGFVLNQIIGSSVYGLPAILLGLAGKASVLAVLLAAAGIGVIMACFAEVSSQFRDAGGPYLYSQAAFGRFVGLNIAWLSWIVRLVSSAANANLFVIYLAEFWPSAQAPVPRAVTLTALIGLMSWVNFRGVRSGTRASNIFVIAKVLPLGLFCLAGLVYVTRHYPVEFSMSIADRHGFVQALLLLMFAYGGFEGAMIPMSEARNPRRDAPFALLGGLGVVTLLYGLVQVVVVELLENAAPTERPLAAAATIIFGGIGGQAMAVAAMVSTFGYLAAATLLVPRLTYAMGERGDFPAFFAAVHPRFRTPHVSIVAFSVLLWVFAVAGDFRWNVTVAAVARLFTYGSVCAALPVLRRKNPDAPAFRLPVGYVFSALGVAFSLLLISRMGRGELIVVLSTAAVAIANWLWARRRSLQPN